MYSVPSCTVVVRPAYQYLIFPSHERSAHPLLSEAGGDLSQTSSGRPVCFAAAMSLRRLVGLHNILQSLAGRCVAVHTQASEASAALLAAPTALRLAAASLTSDHHFLWKRSFAAEAAAEDVEATELTLTDAAVEVSTGFSKPAQCCLKDFVPAQHCGLRSCLQSGNRDRMLWSCVISCHSIISHCSLKECSALVGPCTPGLVRGACLSASPVSGELDVVPTARSPSDALSSLMSRRPTRRVMRGQSSYGAWPPSPDLLLMQSGGEATCRG